MKGVHAIVSRVASCVIYSENSMVYVNNFDSIRQQKHIRNVYVLFRKANVSTRLKHIYKLKISIIVIRGSNKLIIKPKIQATFLSEMKISTEY